MVERFFRDLTDKCVRRGRKIARDQRLVAWKKPRRAPKGSRLDAEQWDGLPETLTVRILRCKGPDRLGRTKVRYVVPTLLDREAFPTD